MFSVLKFFYILFKASRNLVNPNSNPLRRAPTHIKYFASILLGCFWSLAFGLYIGELLTIGYNMLGHVAIISMVFATWAVFRSFDQTYNPAYLSGRGVDFLRQPDRSSRCDELTDEQRLEKIQEWNRRNVWNDTKLSEKDKETYYGA